MVSSLLRSRLRAGVMMGLLALGSPVAASDVQAFGGRSLIVHAPAQLPPTGARALVIVLHGGMGNAQRIADHRSESALNMDDEADRSGFIVAYLNGTPVTRFQAADAFGWNAGGGCCGKSAENNIDDVAYIRGAVGDLVARYGVDPARVFAVGHSNGAMMAQRLVCETHLLAAVVAVSGPLNLPVETCPGAKAARVLAIHGALDENVPLEGGVGSKGLSHVRFQSEDRARRVMLASGAEYRLQIVPGADHKLEHINTALVQAEGVGVAGKALLFFGLTPSAH